MSVGRYVRMYICMNVCINLRMHQCTYVWIYVHMYTHVRKYLENITCDNGSAFSALGQRQENANLLVVKTSVSRSKCV